MRYFLLHHRHAADECGATFASFRGHASALRRRSTLGSCHLGGHEIWWVVDAPSAEAALDLLPFFVASRTTAVAVEPTAIP